MAEHELTTRTVRQLVTGEVLTVSGVCPCGWRLYLSNLDGKADEQVHYWFDRHTLPSKHCSWCFGCRDDDPFQSPCKDRPCYQAVRPRESGDVPVWCFHDRTCPLGDEHVLALGG